MAETESSDAPEIAGALRPFEGIPTHYVNSVNVLMGPYDLTLLMRRVAGATADGLTFEPLARIIMSPQHAKVLSELLSEKVAQFEDIFGPLLSNAEMNEAGRAAVGRGDAFLADESAEDDSPSEPEQPS